MSPNYNYLCNNIIFLEITFFEVLKTGIKAELTKHLRNEIILLIRSLLKIYVY